MHEALRYIGFCAGLAFASSYTVTGIHKIIFKNKLSEGVIRLVMATLFVGVAYICVYV